MKGISTPPTKNYARTKTGEYTGNNTDNRSIDVGVDLSSKNNVCIGIKANDTKEAVRRIDTSQGDLTAWYNAQSDVANAIQSLNSTGFVLGTDERVNGDGVLYRYVVTWEEP